MRLSSSLLMPIITFPSDLVVKEVRLIRGTKVPPFLLEGVSGDPMARSRAEVLGPSQERGFLKSQKTVI
jgi:hypothetical protein